MNNSSDPPRGHEIDTSDPNPTPAVPDVDIIDQFPVTIPLTIIDVADTHKSKHIIANMPATATVSRLHEEIRRRHPQQPPAEQQSLVYRGHTLDDPEASIESFLVPRSSGTGVQAILLRILGGHPSAPTPAPQTPSAPPALQPQSDTQQSPTSSYSSNPETTCLPNIFSIRIRITSPAGQAPLIVRHFPTDTRNDLQETIRRYHRLHPQQQQQVLRYNGADLRDLHPTTFLRDIVHLSGRLLGDDGDEQEGVEMQLEVDPMPTPTIATAATVGSGTVTMLPSVQEESEVITRDFANDLAVVRGIRGAGRTSQQKRSRFHLSKTSTVVGVLIVLGVVTTVAVVAKKYAHHGG